MLVRDLGAVQSQLAKLGISELELSSAWVSELNERLGRSVSEKLTTANDYELASILSGIKTKHLLAPMSALNAEKKRLAAMHRVGEDDAADEMRLISREALAEAESGTTVLRGAAATYQSLHNQWVMWPRGRRLALVAAALPLLILFGFISTNFIGTEESTVESYDYNDLSGVSPFIFSPYRSEHGKGGLLIGKIHPGFLRLSLDGQIEEAGACESASRNSESVRR